MIGRYRLWTLCILTFVLGGVVLVSMGCAGSAPSAREQPTTSGRSAGVIPAPADTEAQSTKLANPGAQQDTQSADKETSTPKLQGKSVAEIKASAPTSKLLDGRHLAVGQTCEGCHGTVPAEGAPKPPETAQCLSCHGGYDALAARTAALAARNPHNSHEGQLDCAKCHNVHRAFEYYCNACHSFAIPKRFQS